MRGNEQWYALQTKLRMEKSTAENLIGRGYEAFVPLYLSRRKWADRIKTLEVPLFAGYIFSRFDPNRRLPVLTAPGVISIVGTRIGPVPVAVDELNAVKLLVDSKRNQLEPFPSLSHGEQVYVRTGAFTGLHGTLVHFKNSCRLVIAITLIHRAVAVEIDRV